MYVQQAVEDWTLDFGDGTWMDTQGGKIQL